MWLDRVQEKTNETLSITWKAFLLEQGNQPQSNSPDVWEDPDITSRDLPPHEAARSVKHHFGPEAFERYHRKLFQAHHEEDRDITSSATLEQLGNELDLDGSLIHSNLENETFRTEIGKEHQHGVDEYDIFGVPTIVFEGTQPVFLKLDDGEWEGTEDVELFRDIFRTSARRPYVLTMKKPTSAANRPPAPDHPDFTA